MTVSLQRLFNLTARVRHACPAFALSLEVISNSVRDLIGFQQQTAIAVADIPAPLQRDESLFMEALANDPPALRARLLADYRETCRRSRVAAESLSASVQ
jgi:hypothetical protein